MCMNPFARGQESVHSQRIKDTKNTSGRKSSLYMEVAVMDNQFSIGHSGQCV